MAPGTIDRYQIRRELGRGGMSVVHLAHDPRFNREVVIKVLPRQFTHDPMFRERFRREAQAIASLEHPAIVPVYDFGEDDDQPFLVMRYMTGGTLADRLARGPLPIARAAAILGRLAPALDEAHQQGIIHRDLKPANILFDKRDLPYLADFGIVKLATETATFTGAAIVGTPAYMSPEQAQGETLTGASDRYSLGIVAFEMLAGRPPYEADTPMGLAFKHVYEPVPRIVQMLPTLPPACQSFIEKALDKEPGRRFVTAVSLADGAARLEQQLDKPILSPPPTLSPDPHATQIDEPPTTIETVVDDRPPTDPLATAIDSPPPLETVLEPPPPPPPAMPAGEPPPAAAPQKRSRVGLVLVLGGVGVIGLIVIAGLALVFGPRLLGGGAETPTSVAGQLVATTEPTQQESGPAELAEPTEAATLRPTAVPASATPQPTATNPPPTPRPTATTPPATPRPTPLPGREVIPASRLAPEIPWLEMDTSAAPGVECYTFNISEPPFDNPDVRRAFALAVDRETIIEARSEVAGGTYSAATNFIPAETLAWDLYGAVGYLFDPNEAMAVFDQAGYPGGQGFPEVILGYNRTDGHEVTTAVLADLWSEILGVTVRRTAVDGFGDYVDQLYARPFHIFRLGWVADYNDPDNFLVPFTSGGAHSLRSGFENGEFDALIEEAAAAADDPEYRRQLYIRAEQILVEEEAVLIPLYHYQVNMDG